MKRIAPLPERMIRVLPGHHRRTGGEAIMKPRIAGAMQGQQIMLSHVCQGGMNFKTTNINPLIDTMGIQLLGEKEQGCRW